MKKTTALIFAILTLTLLAGAMTFAYAKPKDKPSARIGITTTLKNITGIDAKGFNVIYKQTPGTPELTVSAPESLSKSFVYVVTDKVLYIYPKKDDDRINHKDREEVTFTVKAPDVRSFTVSLAGNFTMQQLTSIQEVRVQLSTAGNLNITSLKAPELKVSATSASNLNVSRADVDTINLSAGSASNIVVRKIKADRVNVSASSASNVCLEGEARKGSFSASSASNIKADELTVQTGQAVAASMSEIRCHIVKPGYMSMSSFSKIFNKEE